MSEWIVNAWSRAGISTTILLRNAKQSILLDCGGLGGIEPLLMSEANIVLLSHVHIDHSGGIFSHARSRFGNPSTYILPIESIDKVNELKEEHEKLDGNKLNMTFVGVPHGYVYTYKSYSIECIKTDHVVPSIGFLIYKNNILEVAYSGDTLAGGIDPRMFLAKVFICECTYLTHEEKAIKNKHMYLEHLEKIAVGNCHLILVHFSKRYTDEMIHGFLKKSKINMRLSFCNSFGEIIEVKKS